MKYVTKLGAYGLTVAAAFAVALAVLISVSSTPTAEAATVELAENAASATAAPGDTVEFAVNGTLAQLSITGTADGVGGSFVANGGQSISCSNEGSCDKDAAAAGTETVTVQLKVDADSGEGHILVSVVGLGGSTNTAQTTKVINVSKANLVGSLSITAVNKTIAANDDNTTIGDGGDNETTIRVLVKSAATEPLGLNDEQVTLITTLGTLRCTSGGTPAQACTATTAASSGVPNVTDGTPGYVDVLLIGGGVEGVATITATIGGLTDSADVTMYGTAKNLEAEPQQGSIEIGGSTFIVLTVTDAAGNPVSGEVITPVTTKEVVGPADKSVLVATEKATTATATSEVGVGYSADYIASKAANSIPACGDDNTGSLESPSEEVFTDDGTNDKGQCVVKVTAPKDAADASKSATRGVHTLNFQISAKLKASATIEVAGSPDSITTDAPDVIEPGSVTEITVSVWDDTGVLVGITSVKVRKVGGDGLIEDESAEDTPGSEMTVNGQSKFTFIAPSSAGTSEILISAGDVDERVSLTIGEPAMPEPEEPAMPEPTEPELSGNGPLRIFSGGSVADLHSAAEAACAGGAVVWIHDGSGWQVYSTTAIAIANSAFNAAFADGIDEQAVFITSCETDVMEDQGSMEENG